MCSLEQASSPEPSPELAKVVAGELLRGREYLTQLQALLHQHASSPPPAGGPLIEEALGCIVKVLSVLRGGQKDAESPPPPPPANPTSPADKQPGMKRKKAPRRNGYRRRASPYGYCRITTTSKTVEDGYSWRKYGQKEIHGAKFSRNYFRCTHKHERNCQATRQVQRSEEDPSSYVITYLGEHSCMDPDPSCRPPSPHEGGACIIDFASSTSPGAAPPVAPPKPESELEEEILSRGSFTAGSSSTPELPPLMPDLAAAEKYYFAGTLTRGDHRDVVTPHDVLHYSCGDGLEYLEFCDIPEAFELDDAFVI